MGGRGAERKHIAREQSHERLSQLAGVLGPSRGAVFAFGKAAGEGREEVGAPTGTAGESCFAERAGCIPAPHRSTPDAQGRARRKSEPFRTPRDSPRGRGWQIGPGAGPGGERSAQLQGGSGESAHSSSRIAGE